MKVNFLIGGTQKGGTTALHALLRAHPSIVMARRKELHFFDKDIHFAGGPVDYAAYHACFDAAAAEPGAVFGEATPIYMYWPTAPQRVRAYNADMQWVLLLRNPVERAFSHWNMRRRMGRESLPFLEAIGAEQLQIKEAVPAHEVRSYLDRGFYVRQLLRLRECFPASQLLVIKSELLQTAPADVLDAVCDFLGVDRFARQEYPAVEPGVYERAMRSEEREFLLTQFAAEIRELERLLSWDCSDWLA